MAKVILALETSCDDTAAAVVEDGYLVRSNVISSQIEIHRRFGGVVPEIASRKHLENLLPVIHQAFEEAGVGLSDLDAVAVTYGPGLVGALLVGVSAAKALSYALKIPLLGVNHLKAHVFANFLKKRDVYPDLPAVCLTVSGGHTVLIYVSRKRELTFLGGTRDDAAGEALDKVARVMGLRYPGGPEIEKLSEEGDPEAILFPRAWLAEDSPEFSFSGVKTAVVNYLRSAEREGRKIFLPDLAASFQQAVVEVLVEKTVNVAQRVEVACILLAGGVAANKSLRRQLKERAEQEKMRVSFPELEYCTDNAAMVASAGYEQLLRGEVAGLDLNAVPNLAFPK